jgi:hypothetical protein
MARYRRKYRSWLLSIPATLGVLIYIQQHAKPSFSWVSILDSLGVRNREAYSEMAVWGIILIAIVAVVRILRPPQEEN